MLKRSLRFTMTLPENPTDKMQYGLLELLEGNRVINSFLASSSRQNYQYWASWRKTGGVLPPDEPYQVATDAIMMSQPGVGGEFYCITPFEVDTIGDTRGDFGIHADANAANAPGTLGCIFPVTKKGWTAIKREMAYAAAGGLKKMPMIVQYSKAA